MSASPPPHEWLADQVERFDFIRFRTKTHKGDVPQREWLHFLVHDDALDVLVNFSLVDSGGRRAPTGQVLILVRSREGGAWSWDGDADRYELSDADVSTGRIALGMGGCSLSFDGRFRVSAACRRRPVAVDLAFVPESFPYLVHNVALGARSTLHWVVTPHLRASGTVSVAGRVFAIDGAAAYHDHNWGTFHGDDLAWEWGCTVGSAPGTGAGASSPSAVVVRVLDRARTRTVSKGILLWEGARRTQVFRDDEVELAARGWLRPERELRVPRGLTILAGGTASGIPGRLALRATSGADGVAGEFVPADAACVVVPRDVDLGTTLIHEVVGVLRLDGSVGGRDVRIAAPAFFEFLGDAG